MSVWEMCPMWLSPAPSLYEKSSGKIAIYYGGADTVTALAFCKIDEVLEFLKNNSEL